MFRLLKLALSPAVWLFGRPVVRGTEHVPSSGPVILAGNHLSFCDSLFVILVLRRRVTFLAKDEYFTTKGLRGLLMRWFFTAAGQIPVDRKHGAKAAASLQQAITILEQGKIWGIFPEGTRSPDGRLYRGRTGTIRVALATGAPVVPVVLRGTDRVNPPGKTLWRPGKVHITFCPPLDLQKYQGREQNLKLVREITDELMATLARHSGQEYVDTYATK
ncbi:lysophospholipid acyltransferase family protein [Kineosporia babensis]|uniref:1-acyl-sn-glycerol-3-phosphate acyltransferase n=1 Tax=Kineosporia babensis TaxID=499548 RepID=A0A9X1NKK8_9ACTN|nr:lysophospholipid acyltransferase family protein [Kineosporia babensis]MCD5315274.1 1-acyl-sn-glycerol-3-phosphate acyltransferase [Kineosporia babensis]